MAILWSVLLFVVSVVGVAALDAWSHEEAARQEGIAWARAAEVRRQAVVSLGRIVAPLSISALIRALRDPEAIVRAAAAHGLGASATVGVVRPLIHASRDSSPAVRAEAVRSLMKALPALNDSHYGKMGGSAVPYLCYLLDYQEMTVRRTVLEALEKIGDGRACPYVEKVANEDSIEEMRTLAGKVLTVLLQRRDAERNPGLLLRASAPPPEQELMRASEQDPESLLRPAVTVVTPDPEQMLRVTYSDASHGRPLSGG